MRYLSVGELASDVFQLVGQARRLGFGDLGARDGHLLLAAQKANQFQQLVRRSRLLLGRLASFISSSSNGHFASNLGSLLKNQSKLKSKHTSIKTINENVSLPDGCFLDACYGGHAVAHRHHLLLHQVDLLVQFGAAGRHLSRLFQQRLLARLPATDSGAKLLFQARHLALQRRLLRPLAVQDAARRLQLFRSRNPREVDAVSSHQETKEVAKTYPGHSVRICHLLTGCFLYQRLTIRF